MSLILKYFQHLLFPQTRQHVHSLQQIWKNGCFMQKFLLRLEEFYGSK